MQLRCFAGAVAVMGAIHTPHAARAAGPPGSVTVTEYTGPRAPGYGAVPPAHLVPVRLTATSSDVTFHLRTATLEGRVSGFVWGDPTMGTGWWSGKVKADAFGRLCTAPCDAVVEVGAQGFSLSKGDGKLVRVDEDVAVLQPSTLRGEYDDNSGLRTAGWLTAVGGGLLLLGSMSLDADTCKAPDYDCRSPPGVIAMQVAGLVAGGVGVVLILQRDRARIVVTPFAPPAASTLRLDDARRLAGLGGLTLAAQL
ncbi:MAG: hypothetical protein FJ104_05465 [Deltaproteobacteria bacterium]|nr:hypothetical protein [Deltaproteobacteria bacterium]